MSEGGFPVSVPPSRSGSSSWSAPDGMGHVTGEGGGTVDRDERSSWRRTEDRYCDGGLEDQDFRCRQREKAFVPPEPTFVDWLKSLWSKIFGS